jgi:tetratricopeptide (TPR) repeat protein
MGTESLATARQMIEDGRDAQALATVESILRSDALNVEALVLASDLYVRLGRPKVGVQAAMRAAQLDPNNMEAMLVMATAYYHLRDLDQCDRCLDTAVARAPDWMRAEFYQRIKAAGDVDENSLDGHVVLAFDRVSQQLGASPHLLLNMGRLLFALGAFDAARRAYEKAIDLDPDMAEPYACIGEIEFVREHYDRSLEWLDEARRCQWTRAATGSFNRELVTLRIASGDMTLAQVDRYIARALVHQGRFVEANQTLQSAIEWQPWDTDGVRREFVNEYLARGEWVREQQDVEAAIELWESVQDTAQQSNIHELFLRLGQAYVEAAMRAREKDDRTRMMDWLNRARSLVESPPVTIPPEATGQWSDLRLAVKQAIGRGSGFLKWSR